MRTVFYRDDDFTLEYNVWNNIWFIHCDVWNWSVKSLKKGLRVFRSMHKEALEQHATGLMTITPNPKFCQLLAGEFVGKVYDQQQKEYEVYKWELIP